MLFSGKFVTICFSCIKPPSKISALTGQGAACSVRRTFPQGCRAGIHLPTAVLPMCQAHHIYLDLDDTQLLQMQDSLFCPAVCPDVDHMPISVFFGQALPFAPVFYDVQHCVQHFQVTNFCWLPLFGKAVFDLLILFYC